ncbi:hypothetical protein ACEQ8H_006302 [Pleosporales sp. CAS-2024a]
MSMFIDCVQTGASKYTHKTRDEDDRQWEMKTWRCDLTALSQLYNLYFIACNDRILVYQPGFPDQSLSQKPLLVLCPPVSSPDIGYAVDPQDPHSINRLLVEYLGNDEILLLTCDDGDVVGYRVAEIQRALDKLAWPCTNDELDFAQSPVLPFLHRNVGKSAWGLAVHRQARIIAISANTFQVTILAFALVDREGGTNLDSLDSLASTDDADAADFPLPRKKDNFFTLRGTHNIPAVCFNNTDQDPTGRWLVGTCITEEIFLWDLHAFSSQEHRTFQDEDSSDNLGMAADHMSIDQGTILSDSSEESASKDDDDDDNVEMSEEHDSGDDTDLEVYDGDLSPPMATDIWYPSPIESLLEQTMPASSSPGALFADNIFGTTNKPYCQIRTDSGFQCNNFKQPCVFITKDDIFFLQHPMKSIEDHCFDPIITMHSPLRPGCATSNNPHSSVYLDRQCFSTQVPELGIFIIGSPVGRVAVFALTKSRASGNFSFQLEYVLPFNKHDENEIWREPPVERRPRNPTLSYTQRLEQKIERLEAALAEANGQKQQGQPRESPETVQEDGQNEEKLPLNGSISLFQLPGAVRAMTLEKAQADRDMAANKENLEPFRWLLDSHFCWIQPLFNFVYRPAFTRDMKNGGPYFSQALLNTILSHSIRWCKGEPGMDQLLAPFDNGAAFSKDALRYLFEDVQQGNGCKVPTVQALLLMSAQECGRGNRTQAWLYSGMAFRLIDDMGICIDVKRHADAASFSAEDIEIRNRLFWSCYFWDKLISLYFGRSPLIQYSDISPPRVLMDDTAELETWVPHGTLSHYPPKPAHSISCFIQMCGLAEILNQIFIHLYSTTPNLPVAHMKQCALTQGAKLRDWWRHLPEHLKINLGDPALECPPSHIVTLNCLYHTINILLHRTRLKLDRCTRPASSPADQNPLIQCISSATSIVALFELYNRTFGESHVVLALAYSLYTATSIFLLQVQAVGHVGPATLERLTLCVATLQRLEKTSPVLGTSIRSISRELETLGIVPVPVPVPMNPNTPPHAQHCISPHPHPHPQTTLPPPEAQYHHHTPILSTASYLSAPFDDTLLLDYSYLSGAADGSMSHHYHVLDMPPEMYEAFSQVEPLSVIMDPGFNLS